MKKYNLVIKESVVFIARGDFPSLTDGNERYHHCKLLSKTQGIEENTNFIFAYNTECTKNAERAKFTQKEIDKLPYGFVKLFDIIEVKEELYYIKLPYGKDKYLNQKLANGAVIYADNEQFESFRTCFTMAYIEEVFPMFKQFAVKVEEEE